MIELFSHLGSASSGLSLAILLSGILAGVIAYGHIEIISRRHIQHEVTVQLIDKPFRELLEGDGKSYVVRWLRRRYGPVRSPRAVDGQEPDDRLSEYVAALQRALYGTGSLMPALLGLPEHSAYRLHYRQYCGQIAARINREAMEADGERPEPTTPVTDVLTLIEPDHIIFRVAPRRTRSTAVDKERMRAFNRQSRSERAMVMVDLLQIRISEAIARRVLRLSTAITGLIFIALLASGASYLDLSSDGDLVLTRIFGSVTAAVAAVIIAILLTCAACIIAILTFRLIDRAASPR